MMLVSIRLKLHKTQGMLRMQANGVVCLIWYDRKGNVWLQQNVMQCIAWGQLQEADMQVVRDLENMLWTLRSGTMYNEYRHDC